MKSVVLDRGEIITKNIVMPKGEKGKLIVKVEACCICGTDLLKYKTNQSTEEWGHEILGTIVGEEKKVSIRTSYPCGKCEYCNRGCYSLCREWKRNSFSGFSEYILIDERCVIPLEEYECSSCYALLEPLNVAINLVKKGEIDSSDKVAVIGNAAIGLMTALYLKKTSCNNVTIFSRNSSLERMSFCEKNSIKYIPIAQIEKIKEYNKIICTAPYNVVPQLVNGAADHTDIIYNGISNDAIVPIDLSLIHFKNLSLKGCFPHPQDEFEIAKSFIRQNVESVEALITHRIPLKDIEKAFAIASQNDKEYIKIMIEM